ncbi:MAG: DUF4390 domain-containing protein [Deltaproteobacteria bacterium]|nr:DUF4390 domain-containing protein [Deltaproteobacteria bacterium]
MRHRALTQFFVFSAKVRACLWVGALLFLCLSFGPRPAAQAAEPARFILERAQWVEGNGKLWLKLSLGLENEALLEELLRDGIKLELRIETRLERKRSFWFNAGMAEAEFVSSLSYDHLSGEFKMTLPGREQVQRGPALLRLLTEGWLAFKLPLAELSLVEADEEYLIEADIGLVRAEMPGWLDRTLIFMSKNVVETEHITLDYRTLHAPLPR